MSNSLQSDQFAVKKSKSTHLHQQVSTIAETNILQQVDGKTEKYLVNLQVL